MLSTDQTHLRRYFATLGVAIAAGTLSLAGLFLKIQQELLVTKSTIAMLTPTARESLVKRQEYLSVGTLILPWFVLVGFLGGVGLSIFGIVGWAKRQRVFDEREDLGLSRDRVEFLKLSDTEKVEKLDRDAKQSVRESSAAVMGRARPDLTSVRSEIAVLEHGLVEKLRQLNNQADVQSSVRLVTAAGQRIEVDAAVGLGGSDSVIFELKYTASSSAKNVTNRIVDGLSRLARVLGFTGGTGVLVIVVEDEVADQQVEEWGNRASQLATDYNATIRTYVGRYSDFLALSAYEFASEVGFGPHKAIPG